ncbi:uncharacterized protein EAE97_001419 [Botrytis byssoidea]|uniref:Ubiquitin-like domain-containing protein n=1 Tax=Botrytis byssoidea TaxID=139641 RepID=A0A9P5LZ43_9HELO|nr:uncharacterized protein EAE97_001419 [Botrytis byssoidea]KAF7954021.1 hypothetical protein EAE97_001419 [Botrytis byssoidea]
MSDETSTAPEGDSQITFKVKTSSDGNHTITMAETATVLDLKTKLAGDDYEKIPVDRQRLIYSGRVMKNEEPLSTYKIKPNNTIHMVKSAQSNVANAAANAATGAAASLPTNMAAGTANNPLAGLTGARYAGHMGLPGAEMFGADGGMGAPPSEDALAQMMDDPNIRQTMNEALNNPDLVNMMIQNTPMLRDMPNAREILQSPMFRNMLTDPNSIRQAAAMRRQMGGGGAGGFPAPGVTDTTPAGAAGSTPGSGQPSAPPFNMFGMPAAGGANNPFASLFGGPGAAAAGHTPAQTPPPPASAGGTPSTGTDANPPNPFASLFGGAGAGAGAGAAGAGFNPFQGMPQPTPEQLQQAMQMMQNGTFGDMFGPGGFGGMGGMGGAAPSAPAAPADTRPPEEVYADQLRQLNDMGFFDFDRNVAALRRSGGSVQGAIEQLLS